MKIHTQKTNQRGFLLPAAIFLLVILAGLGAYALNITTVQQTTATQDIQAVRAYHIARAGAELGAYYLMQTSPDPTTILSTCPANASTTLTIDGFTVTRTCGNYYTPYYEQGSDHEIGVYNIESTATFGTANTLSYVQRQIAFQFSKCRGTDSTSPYQCS